MALYGPDGRLLALPAHFGPIAKQIRQMTLSARDVEIYRRITKWEAGRNLEPTLWCRRCAAETHNLEASTITVALQPDGRLIATCRCTRWEQA